MRNALILLIVVAILIVTLGAVNHSVALEIDYVAGTWRAVSLAWIGLAVAGVVVAAGLAAALLARAAAARARRKLESELDETYRRLRDAEARAVPRQPVTVVAADGGGGARRLRRAHRRHAGRAGCARRR